MISQETIQQIISRIDIVEVIGEFVQLKRRGANYLGLCPFHGEKTPSFTVSAPKEIYKCFGCGRSGNTISFLMEHEKLGYPEALRWLAKKYHVEIEETETDPEYKERQQTSDSLYIINQFARKYFEAQLWETETGQAVAYTYLQQRGYSDATIRKFELGYNPDTRDGFTQTAMASQYNPDLLVRSGLIANRDGRYYDNYRDRIIFPIHNHIGKIIGFGARIIKKNDQAPKYINTPENEIYIKSKVLYGIYQSRQAIDRQNECLLVEGYTDVISLHQAGVENVVASGGTSLTTDQLRLIKKYTPNLTIVYDGDAAGIKAALRGIDLALEEGLHVKMVLVPDGEDPDSYVHKVGKDAFNQFIQSHKKDFILFTAEVALKEAGDDAQKRSEVINRIAESISRINKAEDFSRQQDYIRQAAFLLKVDEEGLITLVNKLIRQRVDKELKKQTQTPNAALPTSEASYTATEEEQSEAINLLIKHEMQERAVVKTLLLYGLLPLNEQQTTVAQYVFEVLDHFHFDNPDLEKIYLTYRGWYEAGIEPTEKSFVYYPDEKMSRLVISLLEFPYELSPRWSEIAHGRKFEEWERERLDARLSVIYFQMHKLKVMLEQNHRDLKNEKNPDTQRALLELHMDLKKMEAEISKELGTVILK